MKQVENLFIFDEIWMSNRKIQNKICVLNTMYSRIHLHDSLGNCVTNVNISRLSDTTYVHNNKQQLFK